LETCFNCGEEGHVAVNCPMEKRKKPCFVCGLFGHNAKQCTQVGLSSSEELSLGNLGMSTHALDELTVYGYYATGYFLAFNVSVSLRLPSCKSTFLCSKILINFLIQYNLVQKLWDTLTIPIVALQHQH
jgi:hypothetical protein